MRFVSFKLVAAAALAACAASALPHPAKAWVDTMTFDQFADTEQILSGYDGGQGSAGSSGPNYGVVFSPSALAQTSSYDCGGSGNFANNPTGCNALGFSTYSSYLTTVTPTTTNTMTVSGGFTGSLSFYYASESCYIATGTPCSGPTPGEDAYVEILGAAGLADPLATVDLPDNFDTSDYSLDVFTPVTIDFAGTADEVEFFNVDNYGFTTTYFDNMTLVPEPAALAIFLVGLGGLGVIRRRRSA